MPGHASKVLAVLATGGVAAAGMVAASPAASAAAPDVPKSCSAHWKVWSPGGAHYWYEYKQRSARANLVGTNSLGWQPTAYSVYGAAGDPVSFENSAYATTKGGRLKVLMTKGVRKNWKWSVRQSTKDIASTGWSGTRSLASAGRYVYRLHGAYLTRYTVGGTSVRPTLTKPVRVGSNWGSVRSFTYERTSGGNLDVLLANDKHGRLLEYRLPHATPAKWDHRVLKSSGYQNFRSISTSECGTRGRAIGGLTDANRMYVYYDKTRWDGSGGDIKGGWTGRGGFSRAAFGQ